MDLRFRALEAVALSGSGRTALVTGATGFIGSALVRRLRADAWRVIASTRCPEGPDAVSADPEAARAALAGERLDAVFHLAAYGVPAGERDVEEMARVNLTGPARWVELAHALDARVFVGAGSCAEYAPAADRRPLTEDAPLASTGLYAASKAAGGLWARAVAEQLGLPCVWLRLFGVYGRGEGPHRLAPSLAARLRAGETADLSEGRQVRDFIHIDDAVEALVASAEAAKPGAFNVCTGSGVSVRDFALAVAETLDADPALLRFGARPMHADELPWLVGDPSRAAETLSFRARVDLREGLRRTLLR